jgi:ubiquinone/menaquinone biosynthesis C-methylase UbiE
VKRLNGAAELLDGPLDPEVLSANLRDLARVNRWLGGVDLSWRAVQPLLAADGGGSTIRLLDVGTGAADIPLALAGRAQARGASLEIVATDVRPEIVELATARADEVALRSVRVKLGAPDRIDEPDRSFDIVHASLVLHHLDPPAAVQLLREMARVASRAVIVNDLDRTERWLLGARLLATFTTRNQYTRNDGPLSVRRAYRPNEMAQLAAHAGLVEEARYRGRPAYRYAITFRRGVAGG